MRFSSSLNQSFLIISKDEFIKSLDRLTEDEHEEVVMNANQLIQDWETSKTVLLADFEGENIGWGGELLTAQFLPTNSFNPESLNYTGSTRAEESRTGLFVDARCEQGALLMKKIMESSEIQKLIWGADGDLSSLRHQCCLKAAQANFGAINSKNVIDVQLGFSTESRRLGMPTMLNSLPYGATSSLPSKVCKSMYEPFGYNKQTFPLPMTHNLASYAVDDLHRIEVILENEQPVNGSFHSAKQSTERLITSLETNTWPMDFIQRERQYFSRKYGSKRREKAVWIYRASRHVELAFADKLSKNELHVLKNNKESMEPELRQNSVIIPDNLAFSD